MKAIWRGQVIAASDRSLEVGGYQYFPRETVHMDMFAHPTLAEPLNNLFD